MLGQFPNLKELSEKEREKEVLRLGLIAELDAVNFYEQLASIVENEEIKKVFLDIAKEEKTHVGEFLEMLKRLDKEQVEELEKGIEEIKEILGD